MSDGDFERMGRIFRRAIELPEADRGAFVADAAGDDAALRQELEELLEVYANDDGGLDPERSPAAVLSGAGREPTGLEGATIGSFRVLRLLGSGGMGTVYEAEQARPRRRVALKVLQPAHAGPERLVRFAREAEILARLHHPGIAQVIDAGTYRSALGAALPYVAMELVRGSTIVDHANGRKLGTRERIELFSLVCDATDHAHRRGVVHRDLKPDNVLVDEGGRPRILDFGVAQLGAGSGEGADSSVLRTASGQLLGTVAYMSPEQARGDLTRVDARTDVHALGVILFELLVGRLPYEVRGCGLEQAVRRLESDSPATLAQVDPSIDRDLSTIVGKALQKDPERRYPSAAALRADLQRYLRSQPIEARPPSIRYRAALLARRHRAEFTLGGLLLGSLVLGTAASLAFALEARREARAKDAALGDAQRRTQDVLRLSLAQDYSDLMGEVPDLWPAHPERIDELSSWITRASALADEIPALRAVRDGIGPPAGVGSTTSRDDRWWRNTLQQLIDDFAELRDPDIGMLAEGAVHPEHGWSVMRRLVEARRLRESMGPGGEFAARWEAARPAIRADDRRLSVAPQMGLVPLGRDPQSGLWEFWHVGSGSEPLRGEGGELEMDGRSGIVMVLLPGGRFQMGSQAIDAAGPNFDPAARPDQSPVHEVELSPFFLSKFEMTQGQWLRLTGALPSRFSLEQTRGVPEAEERDPKAWLAHPVEMVSWMGCREVLARAGLLLPTEAQWEYGARAGTQTIWWTGDSRESLRSCAGDRPLAANVADLAAQRLGAEWPSIDEWSDLDDGHGLHAPVGTYAANAFGLHEVHGNVYEWCLDGYDSQAYRRVPLLDPCVAPEASRLRVYRGGSFDASALFAKSARRKVHRPASTHWNLGLRPAGALDD